ncbi:acetyl/propionyl/methylcrotonyl-CoA carboxylase subunit alpha [Euzebya tangerina]|uniref:acetyl/propionyl/methylcrotonyl-CoA carboxylase subunit alpha n=1 Tax=Euzebya tangerina TaxID=591198 RepID=UPI001F0BA646|nr:acetyl-CoA carboxylase biotin carboxylase subunit [Euzebya tangerina]
MTAPLPDPPSAALADLGPVLVANRGEIALRVFRACADLGLESIAVYSEADRDAPWLSAADAAYLLGPAPAAESYLNIARITEVIEQSGAGAVHPGYGFLSENADFARAMTESGVTWVGPPPASITAMGDKISAREAARAAECPLVPGMMEPTDDPEEVKAFAAEHGYPLIIKAAFGGGGRGMKVVRGDGDLLEALESAQREAVAAFGRGEVYVERYLARPRHIEIQILADTHGNTLYLGDRDCSTQRRHQKLIEEAPAPGLPDEVRAAMGASAVRVSEQVGYTGAGTCEYLYEDGDFYFLEMNTRLQVEHPVTEQVTGVDLVEWQLRVAAGEALPFTQDDVRLEGHSIEARINAENVGMGFVPSPGLITGWQAPSGPGVRVDGVGAAGWEIPRSYDSLIAKLITTGADREQARRRMIRALGELTIEGVPTTQDFFEVAFGHEDFIAGSTSTISVETEWDLSGIAAAPAPAAADDDDQATQPLVVEVGGKRLEVTVHGLAAVAGAPAAAKPKRRRGSTGGGQAVSGDDLAAPMQGTIVKTAVEDGEEVAEGDLVLVLEAMKMENAIKAHKAGSVSLRAAAGDVVNSGDVLATIVDT